MLIGNLDERRLPALHARGDRLHGRRRAATDASSACCTRIQEFDPPGVAARDLRECLLHPAAPARPRRLARRAHRARSPERARGPALRQARRASSRSSMRRRRRGDQVSSPPSSPSRDATTATATSRYVTPDVFIQKVGDEYVVTLNDEGLPRLRVSQFYRQVLGQAGRRRRRATSRRRCGPPPG